MTHGQKLTVITLSVAESSARAIKRHTWKQHELQIQCFDRFVSLCAICTN